MGVESGYDFCGWATKNDLKCSDGRVIRKGAFKVQDGREVPLVYNHQHNSIDDVLGRALLHNMDGGVYVYGFFNDSDKGKRAKEAVKHGDIKSLSIWANNIEQEGSDVIHGVIREVSLVLAGANPGAFIESVVAHGLPMDDDEDECILYTGDNIRFQSQLSHADGDRAQSDKNGKSGNDNGDSGEKTVGELFNSLTDEQKAAVAIIVGQAVADETNNKNKEGKDMSHNIFDKDAQESEKYLSHADGMAIIAAAKECGSLKKAFKDYVGDDIIAHAVQMDGMTAATETQNYGINGVSMLLPDYKNLNTPPEFISRNMGWVSKVLAGVHKLPFMRIKSMYADITEDEARAKGYVKGDQKMPEVFATLQRTTDGQMIYKLQKLDREDILDITDFDIVPYIKREMDIMLDEEKARAILIGDGRQVNDKYKIKEDRIRPIAKDVDLFNVKVNVTIPASTSATDAAEMIIDEIIRSRKKYKGSGNPIFFTTEDAVTDMLLIKDKIGHKIYKTMDELKTALRVSDIVTVEPMEGQKIDMNDLVGVIVNLNDYAVGQNPRAKRDMFEDFDIDFNKYTYLKEEKFSGALIKPFSAITVTRTPAATGASLED